MVGKRCISYACGALGTYGEYDVRPGYRLCVRAIKPIKLMKLFAEGARFSSIG